MRYWKGSIALSSTQDYPLLRRVLRSTFVTHRQLYDFMRLEYRTWSRHSFNNRVLRLVKHNYLVRDDVPFKTDGYVYSISGMGALEVIGLGERYTSPTPRTKDGKLPRSVYHAIDLSVLRLLARVRARVRRTRHSVGTCPNLTAASQFPFRFRPMTVDPR